MRDWVLGTFLGYTVMDFLKGVLPAVPGIQGVLWQPKTKFGAERPWYWRFGHFVCGGSCNAEFPNHHLRNAHDHRFHRCQQEKPDSLVYRGGAVAELQPFSRKKHTTLILRGIWMLLTYNIPRWHFSD